MRVRSKVGSRWTLVAPTAKPERRAGGSRDSPPVSQHPPWTGVSSPTAVLSITDQLTIPLESPGQLACLPSLTLD